MKLIKDYIWDKISNIKNFKDFIEFIKIEYGDDIAIEYELDNNHIIKSYIDIERDVKKLANYFISNGIKEEKIVLIGRTSYEYIISYLAISISNNICIPIDKSLKVHEWINLFEIIDTKYIFIDDIDKTKEISLKNYSTEKSISIYNLLNILELGKNQGDNLNLSNISIDENNVAGIIFTSGTTGTAKGVMLSQKNIIECIKNLSLHNSFTRKDSILSILPINHTYEFTSLLVYLLMGIKIYINDSLTNLSSNLKLYKPSIIHVVPLVLENLMKQINKRINHLNKGKQLETAKKISTLLLTFKIDIRRLIFKSIIKELGGKLQYFISGGAALSIDIVDFFETYGINVLQGYGITECSPIISVNLKNDNIPRSVGTPLNNVKVKIVDDEIWIKSPNVMLGYYNNSEETKKVFAGHWFKTGDLGYIDNNSHIFITGRKKNVIILDNGKNVYPEELEEYLQKINGIIEVAVYDQSKVITAEIYKDSNITEDEIKKSIEEINNTLPTFKNIQNIKFRQYEFEKTALKKIKRHLLDTKASTVDYIPPNTPLERELCKAFEDVLQITPIGIKDNFFQIGGDSLSAIELTLKKFENNYLDVNDIYKNPTVETLANSILNKKSDIESDSKINEVLKNTIPHELNYTIKNILLTGANGFLGSHILYRLLKEDVTIYCLVRNTDKFLNSMKYYFADIKLDNVNLIIGDITKKKFGLNDSKYTDLVNNIDTVIHVAANVRHADEYENMYSVNVTGTKNIIDFCKESNAVLHHTSTASLHGAGVTREKFNNCIFNELILNIGQQIKDNVYINTKYQAEELVIKARNENVKSNIYRIGNLTWRKSDNKFQINATDNGFLNRIIGIFKLSTICKELEQYPIDFTPVDECAEAYVRTVMSKNINNIYHLYNPNLLSINDICKLIDFPLNIVERTSFEESLRKNVSIKEVAVLSFYYGLSKKSENVKIDNELTISFLRKLDFEFSKINKEYLSTIIEDIDINTVN